MKPRDCCNDEDALEPCHLDFLPQPPSPATAMHAVIVCDFNRDIGPILYFNGSDLLHWEDRARGPRGRRLSGQSGATDWGLGVGATDMQPWII